MSKKFIAVCLGIVMVFSALIGAASAPAVTKVTAEIKAIIKVKLNGNTVTMKDAKGVLTPPLIYKSKVYLPADVLMGQLGIAYEYNVKTGAVTLGERLGEGISFIVGCKYKFDDRANNDDAGITKDEAKLSIGDQAYGLGFYAVDPMTREAYAPMLTLYPAKKFQKLTFTAGAEKSGKCLVTVREGTNEDGTLLKEVKLEDGQRTETTEVDIGAYDTVTIRLVGESNNAEEKAVVGDIYLK